MARKKSLKRTEMAKTSSDINASVNSTEEQEKKRSQNNFLLTSKETIFPPKSKLASRLHTRESKILLKKIAA